MAVPNPSVRLLRKLRALGLELPEGARLVRTNPSPAARNAGAWCWCAVDGDGRDLRIGSQVPMGELLRASALEANRDDMLRMPDTHIDIAAS